MITALTTLDPSVVFFWLLSAALLVSAAGVAFLPNIVYSAFSLLGTLSAVAGLYLWLGADLLGVAQLLIYVGGVLVLLLFAVLLTNRIRDVRVSNLSATIQVGVPACVAIIALVAKVVWLAPWPRPPADATVYAPTAARLGDALLREYLLPFELVSFVLLIALVGTMAVARRAIAARPGSEP